ncbi:regulatory protein RecX [Pollutibacter soli]|uniref:regulatory protein RecX n=1 Tax=Pollutibacter soli TaxID=3034157 RepID=UPI003013A6CF
MYKKTHTPQTALPKIMQFCAYQERSHAEVKEKLYGFGLYKKDVEEIISKLIEENYLNESRFAAAFVRGKFRMKQWGRVKISYELKQKQVSAYNLKKALEEIDEEHYQQTIFKLADKKWKLVARNTASQMMIRAKVSSWLISRGFESPIVRRAVLAYEEEIKKP